MCSTPAWATSSCPSSTWRWASSSCTNAPQGAVGGLCPGRHRRAVDGSAIGPCALAGAADCDDVWLLRPDAQTATLGALEGMSLETMLLAPWPWWAAVGWPSGPGSQSCARCAHLAVLPAQRPRHRHPAAAVRRRGPGGCRCPPWALQYITPSILALMGVFLYGETFAGPAPWALCSSGWRWRCTAEGLWAGRRAAAARGGGGSVNPRATVTQRPAGAVMWRAAPSHGGLIANHPLALIQQSASSYQNRSKTSHRAGAHHPSPAPCRPASLAIRDLRLLQLRKLGRHRRVATGQLLDGGLPALSLARRKLFADLCMARFLGFSRSVMASSMRFDGLLKPV